MFTANNEVKEKWYFSVAVRLYETEKYFQCRPTLSPGAVYGKMEKSSFSAKDILLIPTAVS